MLILVTGGSGSGKSAFAEARACACSSGRRIYLATMMAGDEESLKRIRRHRSMRAGKGFQTMECPCDLASLPDLTGCTVLLEDLSNLLANEMFSGQGICGAAERVWEGLQHLQRHSTHLVVVTNEIFSDGTMAEGELQAYLRNLGWLNQKLAARADEAYEIVFGIPVKLNASALPSAQADVWDEHL